MRVLVTGCAGFIGSHLTESLLADGESVVGVDCFNDNYGRHEKLRNLERAMEWDQFDFVPIDLARGDLVDLVEESELVFHLAAEPGVRPSWGNRFEQYLRNNVLATQQLLEVARRVPENRFVFASSSSVYGQAERFPTPEDVIPRPYSPYGVTKLGAEHLCDLYHRNHGIATVTLRLFSIYGPRQRPDMAFNIFCRAAVTGDAITVFGDGGQTRDFTYVDDVVKALRIAAGAAGVEGTVLNVGGGSRIRLREAVDLIAQIAGGTLEINYGEQRPGDVRDTCADTSRAKSLLSFVPGTRLAEGLTAEIEWIRESLELSSLTPTLE